MRLPLMAPAMTHDADMIAAVQPLIPALRRYARALLHDREDADDLVQDVLERVTLHWHRRRKADSTRSWLFAILHNLAIDRMRRRARGRGEPLDGVPDARLAAPPQQEAAIEHRQSLALLSLLPADQRSVLLLVGVEELSYAETARVLGVPLGTVMSRLSRGRERLRQLAAGNIRVAPPPVLRIVP